MSRSDSFSSYEKKMKVTNNLLRRGDEKRLPLLGKSKKNPPSESLHQKIDPEDLIGGFVQNDSYS